MILPKTESHHFNWTWNTFTKWNFTRVIIIYTSAACDKYNLSLGAHENTWSDKDFYLAFIILPRVCVPVGDNWSKTGLQLFIGGWKSSEGGSKVMFTSCSSELGTSLMFTMDIYCMTTQGTYFYRTMMWWMKMNDIGWEWIKVDETGWR